MSTDTISDIDRQQVVRNPTEPAIQKQYEIVINFLQEESGRFWTRFNIFTAIELAGIVGILSNLEMLAINPGIFRFTMLLFCLLSLLVIIIASRGIQSHRMLFTMIAHVESKSTELLPLVELTKRLDRLPQYVNFIVAVAISALFSIAWWVAFIYLEVTNYHIELPASGVVP